jgi:hypothetical protein
LIVESIAGTALKIHLEGEEASLFAQLLVELLNFDQGKDSSPVHIGLVLLNKLQREGEDPIDIEDLGRGSIRSRSYGYEDAYKKLRAWMADHHVVAFDDPSSQTADLWSIYKSAAGIKERGSETCEATSHNGIYFCLLEPGHEGVHRWGRAR